jgi:alpha-ketoglutaric semialdehyde dehydrogenase
MEISSDLLIGKQTIHGTNGSIKGINAATGEPLAPAFGGASLDQLEQACALAWQASDIYRELPLETRAKFLETIAQNILDIGDVLIERCVAESGLPRGRIEGERGRTVGQLRMFAGVVREGDFLGVRINRSASRCRASTCGCVMCPSALLPCSARATSRWRSR